MKKYMWIFVSALLLAVCLAGCSLRDIHLPEIHIPEINLPWPNLSLFDKDYYTAEEYQPQTEDETDEADASAGISDYSELVRAITELVQQHEDSAVLPLQNYTGVVSDDLSEACWEVKASTALGAFAVDYISYDISRIVSYYQAEINITYKRSAYQVEAREMLGGISALQPRLQQAIENEESYLVLVVNSAAATAEAVSQAVSDAYYANPLLCPVLPEVTTEVFPESGIDRILEITLTYGADSETLQGKRTETALALQQLLLQAEIYDETASDEPVLLEDAQQQADAVYALCSTLAQSCVPDETAGSTAWDALTLQTATSEGMAMALEAACLSIDIPCITVRGYKDTAEHAWNIVTIDGQNYHVDVSAWGEDGQNVYLVSDTQMWNSCWWEPSAYPVCDNDFYYFGRPADEEAVSEEDEIPETGNDEYMQA